jgi:polyhydroxybutyrate depolymerase
MITRWSSIAMIAFAVGCGGGAPSNSTGAASGESSTTPSGSGSSASGSSASGSLTSGSSGAPVTGGSTSSGAETPDATAEGPGVTAGDGGLPADGPVMGVDGGAASPPSCPATSTLKPGDTSAMLMMGSQARTYSVHVPASYTGKTAVPLVLDFHGLFGNGASEKSASGYAALSDKEGFVIVWPDGLDTAWNVGVCCTKSRTVDDVGFARDIVTTLEGQGCIDPKRVYATGFSMGGGMALYLACNAADVFASVAPSSFDLMIDAEEPCHPSRPITEIAYRGTSDPLVPYDGGASTPPNNSSITVHFLGAVGTFQKFAQFDGCTGMPTAADSNNCQHYTECAAGTEVTLCTVKGGGHAPGNAQVEWAMLKSHPMP